MSFASDIEKYAKKYNMTAEEAAKGAFVSLFSEIIIKTRVDTGRLRGNWQTTTNSPASGELDRVNRIPRLQTGGSAYEEVDRVVDPLQVNYLTNNLPYAKVWEDEDGMVATSIRRFKRTLKEAVRNVTN